MTSTLYCVGSLLWIEIRGSDFPTTTVRTPTTKGTLANQMRLIYPINQSDGTKPVRGSGSQILNFREEDFKSLN
jgi:hypothetical protein